MSAHAGGDDRVWQKIRAKLIHMRATNAHVKVGILASAGGGAVEPGGDLTLIEIAAIHEFGSEAAGIRERSFIRATVDQKRDEIVQLQARVARQFLAEKITLEQALGIIGAWLAAEIKKTIVEQRTAGPEDQANAPSTIAAKGSSTPLVDTGRLMNSINWQVLAQGAG